MGMCCMGMCRARFANKRAAKDVSTQTDSVPLIEMETKRQSLHNEAKHRSSLESALKLVQQAMEADRSRRYEEALNLYQHALVYFLESLNYEAEGEAIKNRILSKCKQYLDRAEKLAEFLETNNTSRRRKKSSLSDVTVSVSRWIENEERQYQQVTTSRSSAASRMYHSIIRRNRKKKKLSNTNDTYKEFPNSHLSK